MEEGSLQGNDCVCVYVHMCIWCVCVCVCERVKVIFTVTDQWKPQQNSKCWPMANISFAFPVKPHALSSEAAIVTLSEPSIGKRHLA